MSTVPARSAMDRRGFMQAAGAAFLATLAPERLAALERTDAVYASAFRAPDGSFGVATFSEAGQIVHRALLPARAHGLAGGAEIGRCVAFARRPGTFAYIFDPALPAGGTVIATPPDRHFFGHGAFSPDGRLLYASENDFAGNRGTIGIYDATGGWHRIGEFDAHGIGTHDICVSADGRRLVIANGGIETHPDFGRTKLNLDRMEPSLVILDTASGGLVQKHVLPAELSHLSTRHLALAPGNRIWFACQYEGDRRDMPPLAGWFAEGEALRFAALPDRTIERLGHYVGAIAVNPREGLVGLSSPKGGLVILDAADGRVLAERAIPEAAGVCAGASGIAVSTYSGRLAQTQNALAFDQHLLRIDAAGR